MKKILSLFVAFLALTFASCSKQAETATDETPEAMTVDALLSDAASLVDSTVTFEGVCSHTCKHGATKMFVLGTDDTKSIRVEAAELGSFSTECIHRPVTVTGIVREQRIDEDYLVQWEEQIKAQTAEQHGDNEAGCEHEKAAQGVKANTMADQIAEYRQRIAERDSTEGKPYLSFYFVEAKSYTIGE